MSFLDDVARARALLSEGRRISLRGLRRQFELDDEALADFVEELVDVQQVALRDGDVLVWAGDGAATPTPSNAPHSDRSPAALTPETPTWEAPTSETPAPEPTASPESAERRQLTVLFCDLVDSTSLSASMDAEDWREVLRIYQTAATAEVERPGGHVAQYMGDGILAYFGYPVAHEDSAERAVRAGLGIVRGMSDVNASLPTTDRVIELQVRIGIHTGPLVLGAMDHDRGQVQALGDTTNVAARLQGEASPNSVVITPVTRRLVQGVFVTHDLGARELRGLAEPVHVIEVERISGVRSLLDVPADELTPMIGREQELGLLEDRFAQVTDGFGQAVLVHGEAGIGKSRMVQAFRERLRDQPHSWLECRCSPYTQDSAFHPMIDLQRQAMSFAPDDPVADQIAQLESGLALYDFDVATALPLLTEIHGLPLPEEVAPLALAPEGKRKKLLALQIEWLLKLASAQPLVMLVEDLHWADPSTLELLGEIIDQVARSEVLVLLTHRPDFQPSWAPKGHVTPVQLARMTRAQLGDLVRKSVRDRQLPSEWVEEIVRRSDGVPLFAEELARTVAETNPDRPADGTVPTLYIPETLQDSLMARLDALGPVKELAQLCAVLGREFDYQLLLQVTPLAEEALRAALEVAIREELFYQRGTPPEAKYHFRHTLIRDAAYQSLLRSQRKRHHLHIANTMLSRGPRVVDQQPELVAHHLTEAGDVERAVPMWQTAAHSAATRSSHVEAIAHLERAMALLPELPGDTRRLELELHHALAGSVGPVHGFGSEKMGTIARHLQELVDASPDDLSATRFLNRVATYAFSCGDSQTCFTLGARVYEAGVELESDPVMDMGTANQVPAAWVMGRFGEALNVLRQRRPYDENAEKLRVVEMGNSPSLSPAIFGVLAEWHLGHLDRAHQLATDTERNARLLAHPHATAFVLTIGALFRLCTRESERCLALAEEVCATAKENAFPLWEGLAGAIAAHARARLGDPRVDEIMDALQQTAATGNDGGNSFFLFAAAEVQRLAGDPDAALATLDFSLEQATSLGNLHWNAELYRLKAEIKAEEFADPVAAEAIFHQALAVARHQQAKSNELRVATSYGRLMRDLGRVGEARELLAPVYEWFREGHDYPDLKDASALLAELEDDSRSAESGTRA